jgi:hypothetical protein
MPLLLSTLDEMEAKRDEEEDKKNIVIPWVAPPPPPHPALIYSELRDCTSTCSIDGPQWTQPASGHNLRLMHMEIHSRGLI